MLTCRDVSRGLAADELRTGALGRRLAIRVHLLMCDRCRRFAREIRQLGTAMRQLGASVGPAPLEVAAQQRILDRLHDHLAPDETRPSDDDGEQRP